MKYELIIILVFIVFLCVYIKELASLNRKRRQMRMITLRDRKRISVFRTIFLVLGSTSFIAAVLLVANAGL